MYVWRGRNRRDKRNLLLSGTTFWGAEKGAKNFEHEDNVLRLENEEEHINYYARKIRALLIQYFQTENGRKEVELLIQEQEKSLADAPSLLVKDTEEENELLRANVFDIFQAFCLPETTYIDKDGLARLFSDLQLTMTKRHFEQYLVKLNIKAKGSAVDFDGFFDALMEELRETTKPKKSFALFSKSQEAVQQEREASLSFKVHRRLQQNAAKILLIEEAVHTVKLEAREEYRKAHPCKFVCDVCQAAFADAAVLRSHTKDQVLHRDLARQKVLCEEKFACVESIFKGHQGRHLRANRLIHSSELGSLQTRIDVAVEDPFRPNIADVGGKRYAQQMKGSMVTGFDAKAGIRPMHKRYGLIRQHLAPMRQKANANSLFQVPQPQLQEVLHHLLRCKDDFIDTVSTCDNPINIAANAAKIDYEPLTDRTKLALDKEGETGDGEEVFTKNNNSHGMCAIVRFQWNMFANNQVFIIGEFTGWKKQEMVCSSKSNKFTIYKQLSPGRYRYRFVIDGVECVDEVASKVPDPKGPGGFTNEVLVTNTPLYHQHQHSKHGVPSPLEHMTRQHSMKKLGLVLPPSAELTSSSAKSLRSPGFGRLSSAASADSVQSEATNESDESDAHSVGEIIHISKHDKEGLIRHLKHIELRNLSLYDDGTWTLASYINRNAFIQMIDLSYNYISDDGIQGFSGCLPLLDALTTLKLNGNGFSMDGCRYLTQNLAASTTLTTLEIANNRIGDDGMEVICAFLKHNEHLQHLYVDTCLIGDDGLECLHDALLFNRRLRSISLMSNRFTVKGIRLLAKALHFNAALESLNVSHNPIGPEAANSIGSCLIVNDTLTSLELANIDLLAHHSSFGVHGICAGIKVNKTLTRLNLKNNKLEDMHAVDIAHVYMNNNVLVDIDLSGNTITAPWFKDYTYIPTHVLPEMPSIETLRHRNVIYARSHVNTFDESKSRYLDDVPRGKWTFRRQWKREIQSQHEKDEIERKFAAEQTRIDAENAYIRFHLADIMITVKEYLEQEPCKAYMKLLTKAIQQFIFDLGRFDSKQYNRFNMSIVDIPVIKGKNNVRAATIKLKRQASGTIPTSPSQQSRGSSPSRESARPLSPLKLTNITSLSVRPQKLEQNNFNMEHFLNAHISIIYAVFSILNGKTDGGSSSLMISPLLLQQAFHFLALPLKLDQVQGAVDATLIKAFSAIGMHRFSDYVLSNAQRLCRESKLQRMRILADLMFNPPGQEARAIIYDHLHHATFNELRDKYRSMAENAPLFACPECHKRFIKQKHLDKHMSKGASSGEHRRYRMKEVIHHSQVLFLQDIKHQLTDVFFPAYYELKPGGQLPKHYYPQVFDKIGSEGRPFGVVEANRTIRVLDVFGEYLHVVLHGEVGWVRYRKEKEFYLQPTCAGQDGFDWDKLHVQEIATYYRVNDLLPKETELKVRYTPKPDAEVLGYLQRGQVIECLAVIGDWLQVRYGKEDTAWVRWRITTPQSRAAQAVEAVLAASEAAAAASDAASASASGKRTSTTRRISFNPVETFRSFSAPLLGFGDSGSLAGGASVMSGATQRSDTTGERSKPMSPTGRDMSNYRFVSPPTSRIGNRKRDKKNRTPGEEHEIGDDLFNDDLVTYEINGIKTKVHLGKHPTFSREKIDCFNRLRYGTCEDGTSANNLLLLPQHFVPLITPPTLPGQLTQKPPSPLVLTQNQIFDHVMSLSEDQLKQGAERTLEIERNEIFFHHVEPSSPKHTRTRKNKSKPTTGVNEESDQSLSADELGFHDSASDTKFTVSFKDDVYGVRDDEDLVDEAMQHENSLQGYDFIKSAGK